ncbi:MAG TPA: alcohol dehydrogenase catalytic domain-containing protein [Kiritimatiellia bacterium]|nr:alcohol dehydrogenase catalytic domain-containing protein [Kiritimatiellia bacterium]HMO98346.1 alcohol dehydrogenase catalytic domain-containing protein [Kiritimatiellia bacterium]HMP95458.1 alcohol dehydrogenase catalytic domain-containing protein [Kiritimatiellia bacterium]
MITTSIPSVQRAVQLTGPDQLMLNPGKIVTSPGPRHILARVEVTGLCFSDLKLLKQFDAHVRKSEVTTHLGPDVLREIPGYVPGTQPTVPGHETVVRVVAVGEQVQSVRPGDRRLVQTDYRWLKTAHSNSAFGYNFEGALQEYVLMDERVITSPEGESMLLPADGALSASSIALVEPWACVEDSYVVRERNTPRTGGRLLHVQADRFDRQAVSSIADESLDDLIFEGADADLLETLFPKMAKGGLVNIVLGSKNFARPVVTPVGRIHYGGVRITGTTGSNPADGYAAIPSTGEIRPNDRMLVVGAAGPMGAMHVIRNLCQGVPGIAVVGVDMNHERLIQLEKIAAPISARHGLAFRALHAQQLAADDPFDYLALMVPAPALVAEAVQRAKPNAIINIFAGIPAQVTHPIDLNTYLQKRAYFIGTSGSTIEDMKIVLKKVTDRSLDTNLSVAAISGLEGAIDGIRAVEHQAIAGKILVYPSCRGLALTPLNKLVGTLPQVAARLRDGCWTLEAEQELLRSFA